MTKAPDPNEVLRRDGAEALRSRYDAAVALNGQVNGRSSEPIPGGHEQEADLSTEEIETEIEILAKLPSVGYQKVRKNAAKRFGFQVSALDEAVRLARGPHDGTGGQGRPLSLPEPQQWEHAVDGQELFDALVAALHRYVVLSPNEAVAVALWVVHAHLFDIFTCTPRLAITSPEKQCGKTTLLDVVAGLVPRRLHASNISPAAVFRTVEAAHPTLLIDEADTYLPDNEELRGVLNAGHRKGGNVVRLVGENHEPRQFATFAPVAIALIGALPGTLADRSIPIRMRRRRAEEKIASFRSDRAGDLAQLASKAARWAADNRADLCDAEPNMGELANRVADNWRPLFAIAEAISADCHVRAKVAATVLCAASAAGQDSTGTMLLCDIRDYFRQKGVDRASSEDLVAFLTTLENRPWPELKNGKPLSKSQLARLLKPFQISPGTIRLSDVATAKGYQLKDFNDAFDRYLVPEEAFQTDTPAHA